MEGMRFCLTPRNICVSFSRVESSLAERNWCSSTSTSQRVDRRAVALRHEWRSGEWTRLSERFSTSLAKRRLRAVGKKVGFGGEVGSSPLVENLPPAVNSRIMTAAFVKSSPSVKDCPPPTYPEIAFVGRSNVGKSSLINNLTRQKNLAAVSNTPGKTKLINHFIINNSWYMVDLPGYGFARAGKDMILEWNKFTREYFLNRETLANIMLLIDSSVPVQQIDIDCANWLGDSEVPFTLVFTKTDKKKKGTPGPKENIEAFQQLLLKDWEYLPACFCTSSKSGAGSEQLLNYMSRLRQFFTKER
ncbi:hypothetical protein BSKO_03080 [Bryopsis sp. KO-2023]|nr:hypothetical protein BSKO_03080 [Bryopsis sp. KO-2023]